jgi:hypothetical protein
MGPPGRCLRKQAEPVTSYAVFRLPSGPVRYTINIVSLASHGNLVRPNAILLDADGTPGRVIPSDDFQPGITGLRAGLRATGREAFLLVVAETAQLGQKQELKLGDAGFPPFRLASAVPVIILPPVPPMIPDLLRQTEVTISLNGLIRVSAAPIEQLR